MEFDRFIRRVKREKLLHKIKTSYNKYFIVQQLNTVLRTVMNIN